MTSPDTEGPESDRLASAVFARHVLIGLLIESADLGRRGLGVAGRTASRVGRFWGAVLEPVASSRLLAPLRRRSEAVLRRGSREIERLAGLGRTGEARSEEVARQLVRIPVDEVLSVLRDDPALEELVREQAQALLAEMADDGRLDEVVRAQGDRYLGHLREHPEGVRELLQVQSTGLTTDVANFFRAYAVALDDRLAGWVDKLLRRHSDAGAVPTRQGDPAGFASRLLAYLADLAILAGVTVLGGWSWTSILRVLGLDPMNCAATDAERVVGEAVCRLAVWLGIGVAAVFPAAYLVFFWTSTGQTPGKALAGVRVVRADGSRPRFTTSLARVAGYALSIWSFGLGFLAILFSRERRGWHDRIARTRVVYTWQPDRRSADEEDFEPG